jgi:hypothetical protein
VRKRRTAVSKKIGDMIREGYRKDVAVAAAHNMKRRGRLTKAGGYRRTHRKKRGPVGRQRAL